jgi:cytochrome c556
MIKSVQKISITLFVLCILVSCSKSQRELAVERTDLVRKQLAEGDTLTALLNLDSIAILYPEAQIQIGAN